MIYFDLKVKRCLENKTKTISRKGFAFTLKNLFFLEF